MVIFQFLLIITGAVEKQKLVYILNRDAQARLTISSPLEAHKSNTLVYHMVGVDVGFDNPTFACLEIDYEVRSLFSLFVSSCVMRVRSWLAWKRYQGLLSTHHLSLILGLQFESSNLSLCNGCLLGMSMLVFGMNWAYTSIGIIHWAIQKSKFMSTTVQIDKHFFPYSFRKLTLIPLVKPLWKPSSYWLTTNLILVWIMLLESTVNNWRSMLIS